MVIVILGLLGLCFGSFVNALVWRLHKSQRSKVKSQKYSVLHGRSMCPHCKHQLTAIDLIPVLSWVILVGKCRYCKKPISIQYPLVEIATASLFILSYTFWPYGFNSFGLLTFSFWLMTLVGFMALIVYDLRWMILPNKIIGPLMVVAALHVIVKLFTPPGVTEGLLAAFWGLTLIAGLFYVLFMLSDGKWIGGGDVKLGLVLGLLVGGPANAILVIFLASLLGSAVGIPLIIIQKQNLKTKLPFGPFLIVATIIVYLFGTSLVTWYRTLLAIS